MALLTDDAWLTMPPLPHAYQGRDAIGAFLRGAEERRGAPMRLVPTRANTQPAFGCYLSVPDTGVARAFSMLVLTLEGHESRRLRGSPTAACFRASAFRARCRGERLATPRAAPLAAPLTTQPEAMAEKG